MKIFTPLSIVVGIFLFGSVSFSQNIYEGVEAERLYSNSQMVRSGTLSNLPSYIKFKPDQELSIDNAIAWITKNFELSSAITFHLKNSNTDALGFTHFRYQQYFNGLPIEDAIWICT